MERLLRRWMWVLDGAAIAVAAIFAAHAAARWVSRVEIHGLPQHLIEDYVASNEETPAKKIDAILRRHIFCSTCEASGAKPPSWPVLARLPLRLVAVMFAPRPVDSRWSVAIIRDDTAKATQPFIVGSPIRDATIHAIEATRVHLRRSDGQREVLELLEPAAPRSGDVIRAINGLDLDAPERALDAYLKLRAASHISIAADRAGRRIQLDYDVR